jgi:hypothetical protein
MRLIFFLVVFGSVNLYGQVGIITSNPLQSFHLAGSTGTLRVESLNATNNSKNLGVGSSTRVFVNADGDLLLGQSKDQTIKILVDSSNYLQDGETATNKIVQTGNSFGYNTAAYPTNFPDDIFTLTGNAIIEVNYSLSWSVKKGANRIDDAHARVIQTALYFREVTSLTDPYDGPAVINDVDGVPINGGPWCIELNPAGGFCEETGGLIALNGQFFANGNSGNGAHVQFKNVGTDYVKLGPGTYVALFAAQLAVGDTSGTGSVFLYLGSGTDELQIVAHYYN